MAVGIEYERVFETDEGEAGWSVSSRREGDLPGKYTDKGRDTPLDGYSEEEFERVCSELWAQGARSSAEYHLQTLFDILLGHYMLTRASKQNQHGRLETVGALLHRKPLVCMFSGLAFYLFYRWDLGEETFPDYRSDCKSNWTSRIGLSY
ncbi:hypothetical protein BU23DRAFT_574856 [Bimuria novae-zelandiae CBS 107.79]|uniref:Ndc10 domain-containing protein n=1 Tax=Bimuria novae-zelandiae CBS 107.79 TaxID=1447943 RepID=A0A6A5UJW3_9PLEO|nr:hypothetical protein BU23DRAFT_574856 [Bimuria novae-zelandiae CBS 107.79]